MVKISIIMPAYNSEKYIFDAIESVIYQGYEDWELIVVNDCSTDGTKNILKEINDPRIKVVNSEKNNGAAESRNIGIHLAVGSYIAFLDSDDIWQKTKLEKQIKFMEDNKIDFCCTYYDKIDEYSNPLGKVIRYTERAEYKNLLKYCPGNSTVIYNAKKLGKFYIPNIRKRNDYLMWLEIIKSAKYLNCFPEVLSSHRVVTSSLSSNKKTLVKYHWIIYRKYEELSFTYSIYLTLFWISKSLKKLKI